MQDKSFYIHYVWMCLYWLSITTSTAQSLQQDTTRANQLRQEGQALIDQADYEQGEDYLAEAATLYCKHAYWEKGLTIQNKLAYSLRRRGLPDESLIIAKEVVQLSKDELGQENSLLVSDAFNHIGACYGMKGYHDLSRIYFERALRIKKNTLGDEHETLAKAYHNLGVVYNKEEHLYEALEQLEYALKLKLQFFGEEGRPLISTYQVMGDVYMKKGAHQEALGYFQKAFQLVNQHYGELHPRMIDAQMQLGFVHNQLGSIVRSNMYFQQAENIAIQFFEEGNPYPIIPVYSNLGVVWSERGNYKKALTYFIQAYELANLYYGEEHPYTLSLRQDIGGVYLSDKQVDMGKAHLLETHELYQNLFGPRYYPLAELCNTLAILEMENEADSTVLEWLHQAFVANVPDFNDTIITTHPAVGMYYSNENVLIETYHLKAQLLAKQGELKDAYEILALAMEIIDKEGELLANEEDKITRLQTYKTLYQRGLSYCHALYQQTGEEYYLDEAFKIAEKNKSVLLTQVLQDADALAFGGIPDSLILKEHNLKIDIANFQSRQLEAKRSGDSERMTYCTNQLFELREEQKQLQEYFKTNYNKYYKLKYKKDYINTRDVQQQLLASNQSLIEYVVADTLLYIFCFTTNDVQFLQFEIDDLIEQVANLREAITNFSVRLSDEKIATLALQYNNAAHLLYQRLIEVLNLPPSIERLIIVPDHYLSYIPFETLLTKANNTQVYKTMDYLIKDYAIQYAYTATLLIDFKNAPSYSQNNDVLAFAPTYRVDTLPNTTKRTDIQYKTRQLLRELPGAAEEVSMLEERFNGVFIRGDVASERQFREEAYGHGIIHLAMHGLLDQAEPRMSSLVFSEDQDTLQDNFLYAFEINNIPLQAQLVVLSACETGYGRLVYGEGSMSIGRSFMYAGARSLVMSMWQVNDQATKALMIDFYENLADGDTKDIALQKAKLAYLEKAKGMAAHPFFWAAFIGQGDEAPIRVEGRSNQHWFWYMAGCIIGGMLFVRWRIGRQAEEA